MENILQSLHSIIGQTIIVGKEANEAGDDTTAKKCEYVENMLSDMLWNINQNDQTNKKTNCEKTKIKCRYFNRGFCKYGTECNFYHPEVSCEEYLREGVCLQQRCMKRHQRHCRYWTGKNEGCRRDEMCQYLHVESRRFGCSSGGGSDDDCRYEQRRKQCDVWESNNTKDYSRKCHMKETEEYYFVTKSDKGKWMFTCKIRDVSFAAQKSVKQHITARHGGPGTSP